MPRRHLLSLCGESKQRRTKGRKDNRSERFSFLPLESLLSFDRTRTASARQARGVSRLRVRKGSSRDVEISISTAPTARGLTDSIPRRSSRDLEINMLTSRGLHNAFKSVSPRALAVRRRSAICGRGEGFQRERRNRLNGFLLSLWHAFPPFRRVTKGGACAA